MVLAIIIESLTELQVTSATEFSVWGGHFYAGTGTKCVEKPYMEGAPTKQSFNLFLKCSTLFALEIHKKGSQNVSIWGGGKRDITSPKTLGTKNSVKNLGLARSAEVPKKRPDSEGKRAPGPSTQHRMHYTD